MLIQKANGDFVQYTPSGVMSYGSTPIFGDKHTNKRWDEHFKKVDAYFKANRNHNGYPGEVNPWKGWK